MDLTVHQEYGWVLLVAAIMSLQVILEGFAIGKVRRKYFNEKFFADNFPNLKSPPRGGYPDMGNGFFAQKLSLEQWTDFNNYQRAHYNYVEGIASILALQLISGLFHTRWSVLFGIIYVFGRFFYGYGYRTRGPNGRLIGALLVDISLLALFFMSVYGAYTFAGGMGTFLKLWS